MLVKLELRKKTNSKVLEYVQKYLKNLDKSFVDWVRDVLQSFEKMRKKIG